MDNEFAIYKEKFLNSPLFHPLLPALSRLGARGFPALADWNHVLSRQPEIRMHSGKVLKFVPQAQGKLSLEQQYEPLCYLQGEVQTRENNWHDYFNALVWLTFPRAKAAINHRHYRAISNRQAAKEVNTEVSIASQRGTVRDAVTLLDESGVIVASSDRALLELMQQFEWKKLFWNNRERVIVGMAFYVIGHGLYEKAINPYIGMTGQGLLLHVEQTFFALPQEDQLKEIDERVATHLNDTRHCVSTRELQPVPLLGIPGWSSDSNDENFYHNTDYFRAGRKNFRS